MMESYLIKTSLSMAVLYLVYYWITRHESNHQLNRIMGLTFLVFSIGYLLIPVGNLLVPFEPSERIAVIIQGASDIEANLKQTTTKDAIPWLLIVYLIGASFVAIRSITGATSLTLQYLKSEKSYRWGFTVVALEKDVSPFTFFDLLFIGRQRLQDGNLDVMLVHEQVHRDQFHSLDAMILEVLTIVFWFNPFIWLFQRDIKAEHEFLADEHVLEKGISKTDYQHFLFEARTGVSIRLGNHLSNKTSLGKRFNMMTYKKIDRKKSFTRVGAAIMAMAVILFVSACSVMDNQIDVPAGYEQGSSALYKTIAHNMLYPSSARKIGSQGTVYVSFTVNKNGYVEDIVAEKKAGHMLETVVVTGFGLSAEGAKEPVTDINEDIKEEVVRTTGLLGKFIPAQKDNEPVSSLMVLPIKYKLVY